MRRLLLAAGIAVGSALGAGACTDLGGLSGTGGDDAGAAPDAITPAAPASACPSGQKSCAGGCVDIDEPAYGCGETTCERCSVPFADVLKCQNGKCAVATCQPGRADCDGRGDNGCEADLSSPATCGSCAVACGGTTKLCAPGGCTSACPANAPTECNSSCVDTQTSAQNCGTCGKECTGAPNAVGTCASGQCGLACNLGFANCDGDAANGCEPTALYFTDADGDGFGAGVAAGAACSPPQGFAANNADCSDTSPLAHPGQIERFPEAFSKGGSSSFDYDCNGVEEEEPAMLGGSCSPGCLLGYTPTARLGAQISAFCGSTNRVTTCLPMCTVAPGQPAVRCR